MPKSIHIFLLAGTIFPAHAALAEVNSNDGNQPEQYLGSLKFTTGFDYSSGNYGQPTNTEIWYVPNTIKYNYDAWTMKLTIPYIRITGAGGVIGGGPDGPIVGVPTQLVTTTESGLGDVILSGSYTWFLDDLPSFELTGKVKIPTADENTVARNAMVTITHP